MPHRILDDKRAKVYRQFSAIVPIEDIPEMEAIMEAAGRFISERKGGMSGCVTIREGIEPFLRNRKVARGNAKSTLLKTRRRLERFANQLSPGRGDVALDLISQELLEIWVERRLTDSGVKGQSMARSTVKLDLAALKTFARWAIDKGKAPPNLDLLQYRFNAYEPGRHGSKRQSFPLPELLGYLKRIDKIAPHIANVLWGMMVFGLRGQSLFSARWRDIHWPTNGMDGRADFPPLKGGNPARVPLPVGSTRHVILEKAAELHKAFHGHRRQSDAVFSTKRGRSKGNARGWTSTTFATEVRRVADKAGLPKTFTAYSCRHSMITRLKQERASACEIQHWAKHKRIETQAAYDHTSGEDARPAYELIDAMLAGPVARHARVDTPNPEIMLDDIEI